MKICLLGASFETGNMGVSALAESSIKVILNKWPEAEITLLGSGYTPKDQYILISGKRICLKTLPIRFSKNLFLPYHFLKFVFYALLVKISPWLRLKIFLSDRNRYFGLLYNTDLVVDITGGDSFSDIYGFRRFFLGFWCKWLVLFLGKKLVLLPQTYGPFRGHFTKIMAKYILNRAGLVYSRDYAGIEYLKTVLNINVSSGKVKFAPDVAFILDSRKPDNYDGILLSKAIWGNKVVVGLNISGLLFNGGYTKDNMFKLKTDYQSLVRKIIDYFIRKEKAVVILIPHVFPLCGLEVESDPEACRKVYKMAKDTYKEQILLANGIYDHNEIKYIIGLCDFFVGSRLHACIAAISQNIPTLGLAYSRKFEGVFGSVGLEDCVLDMRNCDEQEVLEKLESAFNHRVQIRSRLVRVVPQAKENILGILNNF